MKTLVFILVNIFLYQINAAETPFGNYIIDPGHTKISFEISHLSISSIEGRFNKYESSLTLEKHLYESKVETTIEVASLDTADSERDKHLKSTDFFESSKFPQIKFVSTSFTGASELLKIRGKLTIKNITRDVTFEAKLSPEITDLSGKKRVALSGTTKINRQDFGLTWSKIIEAGPVVGDQVLIIIKAEFIKK